MENGVKYDRVDETDGRIDMALKDLPPKLIKMYLALRAQILIRRKHELDKKPKVHRTVDQVSSV